MTFKTKHLQRIRWNLVCVVLLLQHALTSNRHLRWVSKAFSQSLKLFKVDFLPFVNSGHFEDLLQPKLCKNDAITLKFVKLFRLTKVNRKVVIDAWKKTVDSRMFVRHFNRRNFRSKSTLYHVKSEISSIRLGFIEATWINRMKGRRKKGKS